jgi:hypothetical protein
MDSGAGAFFLHSMWMSLVGIEDLRCEMTNEEQATATAEVDSPPAAKDDN